jgi:hypothetical protein
MSLAELQERFDTLTAKSKQLRDERKAVKKELGQAGKELFEEEAKSLFVAYPDLESFAWTQYTPHWNDGDTCHFSVYNDEPEINGEEVCDEEYNHKTQKYEKIADYPTWIRPAQEKICAFLDKYSKEAYEEMFGDGVKITVTAKGIEVRRYSHD